MMKLEQGKGRTKKNEFRKDKLQREGRKGR